MYDCYNLFWMVSMYCSAPPPLLQYLFLIPVWDCKEWSIMPASSRTSYRDGGPCSAWSLISCQGWCKDYCPDRWWVVRKGSVCLKCERCNPKIKPDFPNVSIFSCHCFYQRVETVSGDRVTTLNEARNQYCMAYSCVVLGKQASNSTW